jgi:hypothetical protein
MLAIKNRAGNWKLGVQSYNRVYEMYVVRVEAGFVD